MVSKNKTSIQAEVKFHRTYELENIRQEKKLNANMFAKCRRPKKLERGGWLCFLERGHGMDVKGGRGSTMATRRAKFLGKVESIHE